MQGKHTVSVRYLTSKTNDLETVKNILQPAWPNLTITQTTGILDTLAEPKPDIIFIDSAVSDRRAVSGVLDQADNIPIIVSGDEKETTVVKPLIQNLTPREFKSSVLIYVAGRLIESRKLVEKLNRTAEQLKEIAIHDDLTGLYNKRYIDNIIGIEFKKSRRYKTPVSALLVGIDGLKNINDAYGYGTGSRVIYEFALLVQKAVRDVDIAARLEGDEFLVVLPSTGLESAKTAAVRIQKDIHGTSFAAGRLAHNPTASIGIAELSPFHKTPAEWLDALRKALTEAKHSGKDQIRTFEEAEASAGLGLSQDTGLVADLQNRIRRLTEETKDTYFSGVLSLIEELPFYKKFILPHSERVAFYAEKLAIKIGMKAEEAISIKRGGLLHDIGKAAIDKKVLLKSGGLSKAEYDLVKSHPIIGIQIVGQTIFGKNEQHMIMHHHERFDGAGYPDGLHGTHIPLGARILAIMEAWDTMTTDQPYRPAMTLDKAIEEIRRNAGTQFDPELAAIFTGMIAG